MNEPRAGSERWGSLSKRVTRRLHEAGIGSLDQAKAMSRDELMRIPRLGALGVEEVSGPKLSKRQTQLDRIEAMLEQLLKADRPKTTTAPASEGEGRDVAGEA